MQNGLMKGIDFITLPARAVKEDGTADNVAMTLLPYYAWNNRSDSAMIVWIPQTAALAGGYIVQMYATLPSYKATINKQKKKNH